ncbi:DUF5320 domain-containing protein [Draconibacterium orientale]|uniref:DUF5320 domain-containing protein n=1 Tax=Draconibacterium orientale TaxID=1168034 RepID=UPI0029BFCA69|nr:DUF5320 domain-containing protein [Draconibacterium orientale]
MPSGDRTGPMGQGSMTGRGFGFCSGNVIPGFENGFGGSGRRGFGRAAGGRGFGRRNFWNWPFSNSGMLRHRIPDREEEVKMLKSQAESLKNIQKDIERRLGELEKKD